MKLLTKMKVYKYLINIWKKYSTMIKFLLLIFVLLGTFVMCGISEKLINLKASNYNYLNTTQNPEENNTKKTKSYFKRITVPEGTSLR